jgi:hypothetical protein
MNDTFGVIVIVFIIGILVGMIAVVAISALWANRRGGQGNLEYPLDYLARGPGEPPAILPWDNAGRDNYPRWPGDADNDFRSR